MLVVLVALHAVSNYSVVSSSKGCTMKSTYPEQLGEKRVNYLVHLGWAHLLSTGKYSVVVSTKEN